MDKRLASLKKDVKSGFDWGEVEKLMEGEYEEEGWGRVMGRLMDNMRDIDDDEVGLHGTHLGIKSYIFRRADGARMMMTRNRRGTRTLAMPSTTSLTRGIRRTARSLMKTTSLATKTLTTVRSTWCVVDGPAPGASKIIVETALMSSFQDADFIDEPAPKKSKKDKKGKGKHRDDTAAGVEDDAEADSHLTVVEKADKIKRAAAEYKALDHEDMVGCTTLDCAVTVHHWDVLADRTQIGDMPTRFKYARTAPSSFGLTPVEILLATDAELNAIASVKHIAPYRQGGLGMAGKGLGKRVRELKDELRARKWGEENLNQGQSQANKGAGARARDSGWPRKGGEGSSEGKRPGKRMGKKERMKAKAAAGVVGETSAENAGEKRKEAPSKAASAPEQRHEGGEGADGGEGERKKKRRKTKHGHEGAGGVGVGVVA